MVRWRVIYDPQVTDMTVSITGAQYSGIPDECYTVEFPPRYGVLHEHRQDAIKELNAYKSCRCSCCDPEARLQTVFIDECPPSVANRFTG